MDSRVLKALSQSPKILERMLRVFPHDRLDDQIENDRYTAREVVAHMADYEQTVLDRIRAAVHSPGRSVPAYDPDERSVTHHFKDKEPFHESEVFESRRGMTLDYLMTLDADDFKKSFDAPNRGPVTVSEYMVGILIHDVGHIEQLTEYLATEVAVHS